MMLYWFVPYIGLIVAFLLAVYFIQFFIYKKYVRAILAATMYVIVLFLITPAFTSFSIDDVQPYKNYIQLMPKEYTSGISKIYLAEGSGVIVKIRTIIMSVRAAGAYNPILRTINIDLGEVMHDMSTFDKVIWHEVGHHIWYTKLNDLQRQEFTNIHYASIKAGQCQSETDICLKPNASGFATTYSIQSVDEDFADSFMAYHFKILMNDARIEFMRENLPNRPPAFIQIV